jgi:hypothetical protein
MATCLDWLKLDCHAAIFAANPSGLANATAVFDLADHTKWISPSLQHLNSPISAVSRRPLANEIIATRLVTPRLPASDTSLAPLSSKRLLLAETLRDMHERRTVL